MGYVILRLSILLNCSETLEKKKKKKDFIRNHGRLKQSLKRYSRYKYLTSSLSKKMNKEIISTLRFPIGS